MSAVPITSVFVYGTLKQGRPLDQPELAALRTHVQPATIIGSIYSLGAYPTIQLDQQGIVQGEVHSFRDQDFAQVLRLMDRIEGYDAANPSAGLYTRHVVEATLLHGQHDATASTTTTTPVWVYEYNGRVDPSRRLYGGVTEPGM